MSGDRVRACVALAVGLAAAVRAEPPARHLGAAGCSSTLCHNAVTPWQGARVRLNEFRVWRERDGHAQAFAVLKSPLGKHIGRILGIVPVRAAECLACDTDDVPPEGRGRQFDVRDGVGCEACHGGAERWIESHVARASREDNVRRGMIPMQDPRARAETCLGCHLGSAQRLVTHRMLAAGHPRLSFELDTFTHLRPPHGAVDDRASLRTWAVGQTVALQRTLALVAARPARRDRWDEFAIFECASCHQDIGGTASTERAAGAAPGLPGLTAAPVVPYLRLLSVLEPAEAARTGADLAALGRLVAARSPDAAPLAASLERRVTTTLDAIAEGRLDDQRILAALACDRGAEPLTYLVAEQLAMGIQATLASMRPEATVADDPDVRRLVEATQSLGTFDAGRFRSALRPFCRS